MVVVCARGVTAQELGDPTSGSLGIDSVPLLPGSSSSPLGSVCRRLGGEYLLFSGIVSFLFEYVTVAGVQLHVTGLKKPLFRRPY